MNEQQLADLFSEQIDRMLGGQPSGMADGLEGLQDLLTLGEQLSQVRFQASPAAQVAFQTQLTGWFGLNGGGLGAAISSLPKILLIVLGGLLVAGGLGLVILLGNFAGSIFDAENGLPGPQATIAPASATPQPDDGPAIQDPEATASPTSEAPAETKPEATTSLGDTIPPQVTSSIGDTLPSPTPGSETLPGDTADEPAIDNEGGNGDVTGDGTGSDTDGGNEPNGDDPAGQSGDHDRGHGNDADGFDEDNPGKSGGVPDLSGGSSSSGGGGGGGNAGGNAGGNSGGNSGGNKGGNSGNNGGKK